MSGCIHKAALVRAAYVLGVYEDEAEAATMRAALAVPCTCACGVKMPDEFFIVDYEVKGGGLKWTSTERAARPQVGDLVKHDGFSFRVEHTSWKAESPNRITATVVTLRV